MLQVVAELEVRPAPRHGGVAPDRIVREVEVVVRPLEDRQAELERVVEERRRRLADAAADRRQHERADDHLPLQEPALGRALADDVVEGERLAGLDQRAVDEVGHQMHVVDPVRGRLAHLRRVRDELLADAERLCLRRRQLGVALAELDGCDVIAVRSLRDGDDDPRRVDVAPGPRRNHVHAVAGDRELRVVRALDPFAEPWADGSARVARHRTRRRTGACAS